MVSLIAIIGRNRELGKDNKLLMHIPGELPRFKRLTMGHPIIMGRKTFESIGRILPGRTNIIISRDLDYKVEGAVIVHTLEEALKESMKYKVSSIEKKNEKRKNILDTQYLIHNTEREVFIIGGGQIFEQAISFSNRIYLTVIDADFPDADVYFPDYSEFKKVVEKEKHTSGKYNYQFITLEK